MASTFAAIAPFVSLLVAGDPMLVKADGHYKDGIVGVTSKAPKEVTLKVLKGEARAVADFIKDKLAPAEVTLSGETIQVKGLAETEALDKLAALEFDALPALSMDAPEAGGSIRVGRAVDLVQSSPGEENERFKATVVQVVKGQFPIVTLKIKVTGAPKAVELAKKLKKVTYIQAQVALGQTTAGPDLSNPLTQRNLAASYLKPGDSIMVHVTELKDKKAPDNYMIDYIQRL
jgi:hypothetical protein